MLRRLVVFVPCIIGYSMGVRPTPDWKSIPDPRRLTLMATVTTPTNDPRYSATQVYGYLSSATPFATMGSGTGDVETINNSDRKHKDGGRQAPAGFGNHAMDAVAVGGIGAGAPLRLNDAQLPLLRAMKDTVTDNVEWTAGGKH